MGKTITPDEPTITADFEAGFELGACTRPLPSGASPDLERGFSAGQLARAQATLAELELAKAAERLARGGPISVERAQATLRAFHRGELKRG